MNIKYCKLLIALIVIFVYSGCGIFVISDNPNDPFSINNQIVPKVEFKPREYYYESDTDNNQMYLNFNLSPFKIEDFSNIEIWRSEYKNGHYDYLPNESISTFFKDDSAFDGSAYFYKIRHFCPKGYHSFSSSC